MKFIRWTLAFFAIVGIGTTQAALSPEALLETIDQMTPEQVYTLQQKMEAKLWQPVPEGFFTRMSVDFGAATSQLDTIDLSSVTLSGGEMDLDDVGGFSVGLLWRVTRERFRLGMRMEAWSSLDSQLADTGYSRVEVFGSALSFAAHYQWIRTDRWLVWSELSPGFGFAVIDTVDTPAGQATTLRRFDGSFAQMDIQTGISWRFNPVLSLFASGGYRWAESVNLEEGSRTTDLEIDASGFNSRVGIGINF